jgi:hypothetical protein
MRKVIALKTEKPKLTEEQTKGKIGRVIAHFDAYLDEYPVKSAKSKHAVMGPVAKVLDRAKAGQWEVEPLAGYALRMHEMNPKTMGFVSQAAADHLRKGTDELLELCKEVPVTRLANTIEQIDYGLYFQRRLKGMQWLEEKRKNLVAFLKDRYASDADFRAAWGLGKKDAATRDTIYFFGFGSNRYKNGNAVLRADMDAFYDQIKDADGIIDEEENTQL